MKTCFLLVTLFLLAGCRTPGEEKVIRYRTPYLEYEQTTPRYQDLPPAQPRPR